MTAPEDSARATIDFEDSKKKLLAFLSRKENDVMVLSTSAGDVVTSRSVLVVHGGLTIYFFTWAHSRKCLQIASNSRISLCKDKVSIEGIARPIGPMLGARAAKALALFREKEPKAVAQWEGKPSMVIYKVRPVFACLDGYRKDNETCIEYIDFDRKVAYLERWGYR